MCDAALTWRILALVNPKPGLAFCSRTAMQHPTMQSARPPGEILDELLREPNTERMPALLQELNQGLKGTQAEDDTRRTRAHGIPVPADFS